MKTSQIPSSTSVLVTKSNLQHFPLHFPGIIVPSADESILKIISSTLLANPRRTSLLLGGSDIQNSNILRNIAIAPNKDYFNGDEQPFASPADFLAFVANILQYPHKLREIFGRDKTSLICMETITLRNRQCKHLVISWIGGVTPVKFRLINYRPKRKSVDNKNFRPVLVELDSGD